uniref:Uncharacterized protein n=1 Tax=Tetranychus urticae TaxID=32264 RepID=T1KR78_TETUR
MEQIIVWFVGLSVEQKSHQKFSLLNQFFSC